MAYPPGMRPIGPPRPPFRGPFSRQPEPEPLEPSAGEIFKTVAAESFAKELGVQCAIPVGFFVSVLSECLAKEVAGSFKSTNGLVNTGMRAATNGIKFTAEQLKNGAGYAITKGKVGCDHLTQFAMTNPKLAAAIAAGAASMPAAWFMYQKLSDGNGFSWDKMPFRFKKSVDSKGNEESPGSGNAQVQVQNQQGRDNSSLGGMIQIESGAEKNPTSNVSVRSFYPGISELEGQSLNLQRGQGAETAGEVKQSSPANAEAQVHDVESEADVEGEDAQDLQEETSKENKKSDR